MISIRDIQSIERAAQTGAETLLRDAGLFFPASGRHVPFLRSDRPTLCIDSCTFKGGNLTCGGWGYAPPSGSPLKRLYALVGDRLLGPATPTQRIDVRQIMDTNYDDCGFVISGKPPQPLINGEAIDLVGLTSTGIHRFMASCASEMPAHLRPGDTYEVLQEGITLKVGGQQRPRAAATEVRATIDGFEIAGGRLRAHGWCFNVADPERRLALAFGTAGRILTLSAVCKGARPDVSEVYGLPGPSHAFGFELDCPADMVASTDRAALELVVMSVDRKARLAAAIPAFPAQPGAYAPRLPLAFLSDRRGAFARMKMIIVGPSHILRWDANIRKGAVPAPHSDLEMFGVAGAPIWSKTLRDQVAAAFVPEQTRIVLLVGDTRFGNAICGDEALFAADYPYADGFELIQRELITPENDRRMAQRVEDTIDDYRARYGDAVQVIYWDMIGRRAGDMIVRRHMESGQFDHPSWGTAFPGAHRGAEVIPLQDLFRYPLGELARLYIDGSNHPSHVGYLFLHHLLQGRFGVEESFDRARSIAEAGLIGALRKLADGAPILVAGNSVWIDILRRTLGLSGQRRLAEAGVVIAQTANGHGAALPLDVAPGQYRRFLFVSHEPTLARFYENNPLLAEIVRSGDAAPPQYFPWEPSLATLFPAGKFLSTRPVMLISAADAVAIWRRPADELRRLIEIGVRAEPNWLGLMAVLEAAGWSDAGRLVAEDDTPEPMTWAMDNGVMVTSRDMAFLIEGGHRVLDYLTGRLAPTPQSLDAFASNIALRSERVRALGAGYLHVVFPDKQSVLRREFPLRPLQCLGDLYRAHLPEAASAALLYPLEELRASPEPAFCRYDTHLTDAGSLVVLRGILARLGIDARATLDMLAAGISREIEAPGDLGSKLTPVRREKTLQLAPSWRVHKFHGFQQSNDGAIDILITPGAATQKTLLIFGDSFFRRMLMLLSGVFSKVICLRTRFLHPEMLALVQPDVVLTGNVERYLSNVVSDGEAHAFMLHPFLKTPPQTAVEAEFLRAYRAVTAPQSAFAQEFFAELARG